jgi:hypothetical protein
VLVCLGQGVVSTLAFPGPSISSPLEANIRVRYNFSQNQSSYVTEGELLLDTENTNETTKEVEIRSVGLSKGSLINKKSAYLDHGILLGRLELGWRWFHRSR